MNMNYIAGYFVGLFVTLIIFLVVKKICTGKLTLKTNCDFDERQRVAQGKAYKDAFWTIVIGLLSLFILDNGMLKEYAETVNIDCSAFYSTCATIVCFLGLIVFLVECIFRDAYLGINQKKARWGFVLLAIGIFNLIPTIIHFDIHEINDCILSLCCAAFMLSGAISLFIKLWLDQKELADEE